MMKNDQHTNTSLKHKFRTGKKLITAALIGCLLLVLAACGSKKTADIKVLSGSYVQEIDQPAKNGQGYLALKINIRNTTGQEINVSSDNFKLMKRKQSISPASVSVDGISEIDDQKLDKNDSTSGYVFFKVNKKDKYQLKFSPEAVNSENDDKLGSSTTTVNAKNFKDPGASAKAAAKQYIEAVFLNNKTDQQHNDLANNVNADAKKYHDDFVNGLRNEIDKDDVTDQQADKIFQDYVSNAAKRDQISYKVYEAGPDKVTIEVVAKNVNIDSMNFDQLSSDFEKDFMNNHKDDDNINEDEVDKEAAQYVLNKLPDMISKAQVSTDETSGYQLNLTKKDGKWDIATSGSDSSGYSSLRDQFLAGLSD